MQDFAKLKKKQYYYVDKTQLIYLLIDEEEYYFLARPRRFGKSAYEHNRATVS
ncbi:MAG: AAA family ATPase [Proteobacteria bacterium]|nr:AAA family ATPase [Pseudomonadota bacterium]